MARTTRYAVTRTDASARDLTERERKLVDALLSAASTCQKLSIAEAARLAGYAPGDSGRVTAHAALRRPAVRQAILAGIPAVAGGDAIHSYFELRKLVSKGRNERERLAAIRLQMSIAGIAGVNGGEQPFNGPAVAIQFVLPPGIGDELRNAAHLSGAASAARFVIAGEVEAEA